MFNDNSDRPTGAEIGPGGRRGTWVPVNYLPGLAHIDVNVLATLLVAEGALVASCRYTDDPHTLDALWPEDEPGSPQDIIDSIKGWPLGHIVHRACSPRRDREVR